MFRSLGERCRGRVSWRGLVALVHVFQTLSVTAWVRCSARTAVSGQPKQTSYYLPRGTLTPCSLKQAATFT